MHACVRLRLADGGAVRRRGTQALLERGAGSGNEEKSAPVVWCGRGQQMTGDISVVGPEEGRQNSVVDLGMGFC